VSNDRCTRLYAEIDFVPAWFTRSQLLRRSKKRQVLLAALMIGGMAALTVQTWRDRAELRAQLEAMQTSLVNTKQKITEVEKLRDERAKLIRFTGGGHVIERFYDLDNDPCELFSFCTGPAPCDPDTLRADLLPHYLSLREKLTAMGVY